MPPSADVKVWQLHGWCLDGPLNSAGVNRWGNPSGGTLIINLDGQR
jgi:hypothetical protein